MKGRPPKKNGNTEQAGGDKPTAKGIPLVGIFRTDTAGNYVYVNQAWCDITGLSRNEAMADGWQKAVHEDDRIRLRRLWADTWAAGADSFVAEYRIGQDKSAEKWVHQHAEAIRESGGNITSYIGSLIDITDRKQAELELRELEDRLRRS